MASCGPPSCQGKILPRRPRTVKPCAGEALLFYENVTP